MPRFANRTRIEIIYEMLSVCLTPTSKTHIMYRCNMSLEQLNRYLDLLVSSILLRHSPKERKYQTTEKGKEFIKQYEHLKDLLGER